MASMKALAKLRTETKKPMMRLSKSMVLILALVMGSKKQLRRLLCGN